MPVKPLLETESTDWKLHSFYELNNNWLYSRDDIIYGHTNNQDSEN